MPGSHSRDAAEPQIPPTVGTFVGSPLQFAAIPRKVSVSSVVAFLVMKGMALHDLLNEKDAWDIYFTLVNYPGGQRFVRARRFPSQRAVTLLGGSANIFRAISSAESSAVSCESYGRV